jgi:hypothetical protein
MADMENDFLAEFTAVISAPNDQFNWISGVVAFLDPFLSGLDDRGNEIKDAFRQSNARRSDGQKNQQLRAALMLDKLHVRRQAGKARINQLVGPGRMLTMKAAGTNAQLDRDRQACRPWT